MFDAVNFLKKCKYRNKKIWTPHLGSPVLNNVFSFQVYPRKMSPVQDNSPQIFYQFGDNTHGCFS